MSKCSGCRRAVSDAERSFKRIAELLRDHDVRKEATPQEAAKRIGPLCPDCLRSWETTIPKQWGSTRRKTATKKAATGKKAAVSK
jgi:hypothetical protein